MPSRKRPNLTRDSGCWQAIFTSLNILKKSKGNFESLLQGWPSAGPQYPLSLNVVQVQGVYVEILKGILEAASLSPPERLIMHWDQPFYLFILLFYHLYPSSIHNKHLWQVLKQETQLTFYTAQYMSELSDLPSVGEVFSLLGHVHWLHLDQAELG